MMNSRQTSILQRPLLRYFEDRWMLCLLVSCLAVTATAWPDGLERLRYDRLGLASWEVWRIFSAHLVHLNAYHLFFNLFGMAIICELQWGTMPLRHGFGLIGFSGMGISLALWWLCPELEWYAGLSGILHGLWAGCALYGLTSALNSRPRTFLAWLDLTRPRSLCLAGLILIAIKLALEYHYGPAASTEQLIGAHVVTASHRYGALAGMIYILLLRARCLSREICFRLVINLPGWDADDFKINPVFFNPDCGYNAHPRVSRQVSHDIEFGAAKTNLQVMSQPKSLLLRRMVSRMAR